MGVSDFNILGILSKLIQHPGIMEFAGVDFAPTRIDYGENIHIIAGTQGELCKIDSLGVEIGKTSVPLPAPCIDGIILDDVWVGIWLDREFRHARMSALPLLSDWTNGPSREELRKSITFSEHDLVGPESSIWHRELDSEPLKIGAISDGLVFATTSGVYKISKDAKEIWRGMLPRWPEISDIGRFDRIVGIIEFSGGLAIWTEAGGVAVLDPSNGLEIFSRVIKMGEKISKICYSEVGGWLILLHGNYIATMESIEDSPRIKKILGPPICAEFDENSWFWTGWRNDGRISDGEISCTERKSIGVGILNRKVLTNNGTWSDFASSD